eukprot:15332236-Alexandrium_andersonii.AAC.1
MSRTLGWGGIRLPNDLLGNRKQCLYFSMGMVPGSAGGTTWSKPAGALCLARGRALGRQGS